MTRLFKFSVTHEDRLNAVDTGAKFGNLKLVTKRWLLTCEKLVCLQGHDQVDDLTLVVITLELLLLHLIWVTVLPIDGEIVG